MTKWLFVLLVVGLGFFAWSALITLLARAVGLRVPFVWPLGIGRRKSISEFRQLTQTQYITFEGVLRYGLGVPLLVALAEYVAFRLGMHGPLFLSRFVPLFVMFVAGGMYVGFKGWRDIWNPLI